MYYVLMVEIIDIDRLIRDGLNIVSISLDGLGLMELTNLPKWHLKKWYLNESLGYKKNILSLLEARRKVIGGHVW